MGRILSWWGSLRSTHPTISPLSATETKKISDADRTIVPRKSSVASMEYPLAVLTMLPFSRRFWVGPRVGVLIEPG
jgi:hypothetical protein